MPGTATLSGITTAVSRADWYAMDAHSMDQQGGYQMPAQMMPGAPAEGEARLGVRLTLHNTSELARQFNPVEEFLLLGGSGAPRVPHSDTFGRLTRLNPGSAVDGTVYFDTVVPKPDDPPLALRWVRGGEEVILAISIGDAPSGHHGP
ncbi:hypothetical protein Rhe02_49780 [Rhizocola hellebori]|uniref:DUF4352 domain-containing protein n=1 Tax=Rhizocola hellebori TaxID=1392758 RepID=A0A8J3VIC5_9ACTN|nr:hypothetical protein [Rhizocola hellebori]GIH06911.1 hypothetical protein Rhe02_49780 [Rhizocola hellebori]